MKPLNNWRIAVVAVAVIAAASVFAGYSESIFHKIVGACSSSNPEVLSRTASADDAATAAQDPTPRPVLTSKASSITSYRSSLIASSLPKFDEQEAIVLPFASFDLASGKAIIKFVPSTFETELVLPNGQNIALPKNGVPVKVIDLGPREYSVFFREFFTNKLWIFRYENELLKGSTQIKTHSDSEPILREALLFEGRILAILYDNDRGRNDVVVLDPNLQSEMIAPEPIATLPTLEDPAGTHYEMMPSLFMLPKGDRVWIIGGTLLSTIDNQRITFQHRLTGCIRAQEVVSVDEGIAVVCLLKDGTAGRYSFSIWNETGQLSAARQIENGMIPFRLRAEQGQPAFDVVRHITDVTSLLKQELSRSHLSGVMEFGSNNIEGRVAWSQIYFLNGLLDIIHLSQSDNDAFERLGPLAVDAKRRLDAEIYVLNKMIGTPVGYLTKAFTVKREPALFAVQTARLLLLFERYRREIRDGVELTSYENLKDNVISLDGHIDQLVYRNSTDKSPSNRSYLAWPKGSAFYFDGLNVPYNHQNEWAYSIFETISGTLRNSPILQERAKIAGQIINRFIEDVAPDGEMPKSGEWPYWWGKAHLGWTKEEGISVHTPSYGGDKSIAFISFRSIDTMSVLAAEKFSNAAANPNLINSIRPLISEGHVYPFVNASLLKRGERVILTPDTASLYSRMSAPWELQGAVWALLDLRVEPSPEDPHSRKLNSIVLQQVPAISEVRPDSPGAVDTLLKYLSIAIPYNAGVARLHEGLELGGKYIAWNLGYDLDAAVAAFERTRQPALRPLIEQGLDAAFGMRDDKLGLRDDIRGRVMPAWGTNRYSPNKKDWMSWDAFTGAIIHPAIIYADLIRNDDKVPAIKADTYIAGVIQSIDAFNPYWREDVETGEGWYFDPLYQDVAPLNHMNLLGLAHVELCSRFDRSDSCAKASGLATFFKRHLTHAADGTCRWEYWAGAYAPKHRSTAGEDITHAHINVRFAFAAWKAGHGLEKSDIACIANTLDQSIIRSSGDWAMAVDGSGSLIGSGLHEGISAWGILDELKPGVQGKIDEFIFSNPGAFPLGLFSYATGPASFARSLPQRSPN